MRELPTLPPAEGLTNEISTYLAKLHQNGFTGDVSIDYASRLSVATDNSIYQQLPQAVLHPANESDLQMIARLASGEANIKFSARGGGTGTNGQSLTPGIVVDTSRHMRSILELNLKEGWVRVQSGVVKDQLNDFLKPHGYFFSPDLSTSNRATIGGMISTDASGQGSLVYGKTSDHVLALSSILATGDVLDSHPVSLSEARELAKGNSVISRIYQQVIATCVDKRQQIVDKFPKLNRFLTGYDLAHAYDPNNQTIDLSRLVCGAEGSLGFIAQAKLNLTKIPTHTALVNVKYDLFESALRHAPSMIAADATSVETVDSKVLNLAKTDIIWHSVSSLITDVPEQTMLGLNMVEYNSDDKQEIAAKIAQLEARLDSEIADKSTGVIGYQVTWSKTDIQKIYAMRKKSVGLLGKTKGDKKPIAFVEDTAVPPENLADFIMEFRALLDEHGLNYGMFGHVDAGVLHVRPALDLCDPAQEALLNKISDQVVALVAKYGGLMWGEHGKGYRSQYAPAFFGEELYNELCRIKAAFDANNQMNPGKICTPYASSDQLVKVSDTKRATFDRTIPINMKNEYEPAMSCNGNGLCFNYDTKSPMCPSSKISADRRHSPKGRAGLIREWLRMLHVHDAKSAQYQSFRTNWFKRAWNTLTLSPKDDFSLQVMEAMQGCLACKSCSSQCPVGVDVPDFRSRFMAVFYTKYLRAPKDYLVANIESMAPVFARVPQFANLVMNNPFSAYLTKKLIGYVDTPRLSVPNLAKRVAKVTDRFDFEALQSLSDAQRQKHVIIVQDPFTSFYDAESVEQTIKLLSAIGYQAILLPFVPNGKAQHVKGFLAKFERTARSTSQFLNKIAKLNIPMIGVDASLVLCYRDEYNKILGTDRGEFHVETVIEWLSKQSLPAVGQTESSETEPYQLLAHCSEKTAIAHTEKSWQAVFKHFGMRLDIVPVGCCGMAGTYGHENENFSNSEGIYNLSWSPVIAEHKSEYILATGYSCRSQVKRFADYRPRHPIEVLAERISANK